MDKPTERQPVDDFFRRNLNDASVPPRADGWNRLQSRLLEQQLEVADKPNRRIGAAWYWTASVAAACLLVVYFWVNSNQSTIAPATPELATTIRSAKKTVLKPEHREENIAANETASAPVTTPTESVEPSIKPLRQLVEKQPEQSINVHDRLNAEPKTEVEQPRMIAKNSEKQPERVHIQPTPERTNTVASINSEAIGKAAQTGPERTLIVSVAEANPNQLPTETVTTQDGSLVVAQEAPVKNTRIAHVFRQIKRLKDGEALAKADVNSDEEDDDSGLFNRLVRSARSKENQVKQQK